MKKLKKFKRFSQGGLGSSEGYGDPFANKTDFSAREQKAEERKESKAEERKEAPVKAEPVKAAETSSIIKPSVSSFSKDSSRDSAKDTEETSFAYPSQREHNQALEDAKEQGRRAMAAFKPASSKPAADKAINISTGASGFKFPANPSDKEAGMSRGRREEGEPKTTTSSSKPAAPKAAPGPENIPKTDVIPGPQREKIDNSGQFAQSAMAAFPALRGVGAGVRGAMSLGRMLESAPKAEGAGTGKFPESKPVEVSNKPAVDRVKDAKIEGPPKPPRQETSADKMGVRETSAMEKTRKANEEGPPDVGARARRVAEDTAKADKQAETTMAAAGRRAQQTRADEKQAADAMSAASKRAKENRTAEKQAADTMASAGARAKETRASEKQASDAMAAANKRTKEARAQNRIKNIKEEHRQPGFMQEYIAGRAEKRNRIKDLPNDGLSAERFANKKGGKIPAFKKGGLVGRADGCAIRGRTKGRMV